MSYLYRARLDGNDEDQGMVKITEMIGIILIRRNDEKKKKRFKMDGEMMIFITMIKWR